MNDPLLTAPEIAAQLHCHPKTALDMMSDGRITSVRIGRQRQARQSWVDAFVDSQAAGGPGPRAVAAPRRRAS
jgi:excisionase family DNA binding protein